MSRILEITTPENVAIRYELAGFGSRGMAAAMDLLLQILIYLLLGVLAALILGLLTGINVFLEWDALNFSTTVIEMVLILGYFVVYAGYYIAFEALWNGETPGKRWMKLRVIKDGGYPVDFRAVLLRNLLRVVDALPALPGLPSYGLALISVAWNPHYKRLGDLAAGTLVVRHARDEAPRLRRPGFGDAVVNRLLDAAVLTQLSRLTRDEYRMVQRFLERRRQLPQPLRGEFARRLADPLIVKFAYQIPPGMDYERWLEELDLAYRNRTLGVTSVALPTSIPAAPAAPPVPPPADEPAPPSDGRKW